MRLPQATNEERIYDSQVLEFRGLNNSPNAEPNELKDMKNLCSDHYPYLSTRKSRGMWQDLNGAYSLFAGERLCWVRDGEFFYDGQSKGMVDGRPKSMVDFNGRVVIFPDKKYYDYIEDEWGEFEAPDLDYVAVHYNRIFGVKGNDIHACALGQFEVWEEFEGLLTDSWAADVGTQGDFTGITSYQNHLVLFKESMLHELYGNKPSNFQIQDLNRVGTVNNKTVVEVNSVLYYMNQDGIYAYTGSRPEPISKKIHTKYIDGVAGGDHQKYYISIYDGEDWTLYVYDTLYQFWHKEDNIRVYDFVRWEGELYGLTDDGIIKMETELNEKIQWYMETQEFDENTFGKKGNSKIQLRTELEKGSYMAIKIKQDNGPYKTLRTFTTPDKQTLEIPIRIHRADRFQVRIEGLGDAKILGINRNFYVGGGR